MTTARNQAAPAVPVSSADPVGDVVAPLRGTVVEIGAGRGANVAVLHPSVRWIAVEPNLDRRRALRAAAERRGGGSRVIVGRAESLPLLDGCADAVLSTRVLCSVDDPEAALAEVIRVLRPGGVFAFVEHVGAPRRSVLRVAQQVVAPWSRLFDGCDPRRDIEAAIARAGFATVELRHHEQGRGLDPWRPHIAGHARRRTAEPSDHEVAR